MSEPRACTVAELIELLKRCPPDLPVLAEGCDCHGAAFGVSVGRTEVTVTRTEHNKNASDEERFQT